MIFSYYFDVEKTHLINMKFNVKQMLAQNGLLQIAFDAVVEEVLNGSVVHAETQSGSFTLSPNRPQDPTLPQAYDINFLRTRYADQNKWIFEVQNNAHPDQVVTVGLYSKTAQGNPLGVDIIHDDGAYNFILKGNNISQLEQTYVPPVLTQNIANCTFSTVDLPDGFTTQTGEHQANLGMFYLADFSHTFPIEVDPATRFEAAFNLAPLSTDTVDDELLRITVHGIGTVSLFKTYLRYLREDDDPQNAVAAFFPGTVDVSWFRNLNQTFTENAGFSLQADGAGSVLIRYAGVTLTGTYDPSRSITGIDMQSGARQDGTKVVCAFDNYAVKFFK